MPSTMLFHLVFLSMFLSMMYPPLSQCEQQQDYPHCCELNSLILVHVILGSCCKDTLSWKNTRYINPGSNSCKSYQGVNGTEIQHVASASQDDVSLFHAYAHISITLWRSALCDRNVRGCCTIEHPQKENPTYAPE